MSEELIAAALVKALGEMKEVSKGRTANAGTYSYKYADLSDALDLVRPILAKHGLGVVQAVQTGERAGDVGVAVSTVILHESGQSMTFGPLVMPTGNTPQATGSAITYARRYSLMAALGLATEDDDGQAAAPQPAKRQTQKAQQAPPDATPKNDAPADRVAGDDDEIHEMRCKLAAWKAAANPNRSKFMTWVTENHATNNVAALKPEQVRAAYLAVVPT